jgi:hypothetical protein
MLVAARVSEFIGYLEKGQIPPKVNSKEAEICASRIRHGMEA